MTVKSSLAWFFRGWKSDSVGSIKREDFMDNRPNVLLVIVDQ